MRAFLQFSKAFQGLPQDRIEEAFDRFAREEFRQGHQIVKEGEPISKMYIIKMGELACTRGGLPVTAIQEAGGFSYFGEQAVLSNEPSPVTITVQSESCMLLGASRRALAQLMGQGPAVMGISADDAALASSALKATAVLQDLSDTEIKVCSRAQLPRVSSSHRASSQVPHAQLARATHSANSLNHHSLTHSIRSFTQLTQLTHLLGSLMLGLTKLSSLTLTFLK